MTPVRAVRFHHFGGPSELAWEEVDDLPTPAGRLRVRVEAAGLNVFDSKRREGRAGEVRFPAGNGSDFAGVVEEVGDDAGGFSVGEAVLGRANFRAQADVVRVRPEDIVARPAEVPVEIAGALDLAARTAADAVAGIRSGDTVLVSAAAGGVGIVAVQLARRAGATVLGTASERNAAFLESLGVVPVVYGNGLAERVRRVSPGPVTAVLDLFGRDTIEAGLELGVAPERILTLADRQAAVELGAAVLPKTPADATSLARVVALVASGEVVLPLDRVFPAGDVARAYEHFETRHVRGKVVLRL